MVTALFLVSCSVLFVSPYDETTDRAITELVTKTETFLGQYAATVGPDRKLAKPGKPYDDQAAKFYNEARGESAAILLRAELREKNEEEIKLLNDLGTQYDALEATHRLGRITKTSAAGLHFTLRALVHEQLTKKHIGTGRTVSPPSKT